MFFDTECIFFLEWYFQMSLSCLRVGRVEECQISTRCPVNFEFQINNIFKIGTPLRSHNNQCLEVRIVIWNLDFACGSGFCFVFAKSSYPKSWYPMDWGSSSGHCRIFPSLRSVPSFNEIVMSCLLLPCNLIICPPKVTPAVEIKGFAAEGYQSSWYARGQLGP